jgi:hypothetical protein
MLAQLDYVKDIATRAGRDTSRVDFNRYGAFRPGFAGETTIAALLAPASFRID